MTDFKRSLLNELNPTINFRNYNDDLIDGELEAALYNLVWNYQESSHPLEFRAVIDHVLRWNGLELGIEYLPGQVRFSGTKKLRSGYGHIRGFRDETGEAPDIYVAQEVFNGEGSDRLFRISQVSPEDGDFDEYKWMVGYPSMEAAKQAYLAEMPTAPVPLLGETPRSDWLDYFGGIIPASIIDLNKYRKNLDFAESQELRHVLDDYTEQAARKSQKIVEQWSEAIAAKIKTIDQKELSDEYKTREFTEAIPELYKKLDEAGMAEILGEVIAIAEAIGRTEILP